MSEEPLDDVRHPPTLLKVLDDALLHLAERARPLATDRVGLDIVVEQLDRVQLGL
jgi:hypothetical protein